MIFAISSIDEAALKFIKYLPLTTKAGTWEFSLPPNKNAYT